MMVFFDARLAYLLFGSELLVSCVKSHLFGLGRRGLHETVAMRSSLVVVFGEVGVTGSVSLARGGWSNQRFRGLTASLALSPSLRRTLVDTAQRSRGESGSSGTCSAVKFSGGRVRNFGC
jgi:hypothetical protein